MIICITGTPGTGKTAVARELKKSLTKKSGRTVKMMNISRFVTRNRLYSGIDKKRKTRIVDVSVLKSKIGKETGQDDRDYIIDGHLSHFLEWDLLFVLRTCPPELMKRLRRKGWSTSKVKENTEAEILGIIHSESYSILKQRRRKRRNDVKMFEIDTTGKRAFSVANDIMRMIDKGDKKRENRSTIDWSVRYGDLLVP